MDYSSFKTSSKVTTVLLFLGFIFNCSLAQDDQQQDVIESIIVPEFGEGAGQWNYSPQNQLEWKDRADSTCGTSQDGEIIDSTLLFSQSPVEFVQLDRITHCLGPRFTSMVGTSQELNFMIQNNQYDVEIIPVNSQRLEFTGIPTSQRDVPNTQVACNSAGTFVLDRIKVKYNSRQSELDILQGNAATPGSEHRPMGEMSSSMELQYLFYRNDLPNFDLDNFTDAERAVFEIENARVIVSVFVDVEDNDASNLEFNIGPDTVATSSNEALREATSAILFGQFDNDLVLNQVDSAVVFNISDVRSLLPQDTNEYYVYNGTLSFPPCTTNIKRLVLMNRLSISSSDLAVWRTILNGGNETDPISDNIRYATTSPNLFLIGNNLQTSQDSITRFVFLSYIITGILLAIASSSLFIKLRQLNMKKNARHKKFANMDDNY